ncbi:MAG TPA: FUSC family protein [Acidobacteriaceae bacterium]|jgi:multidrug resistance protein MdtO
MSASLATWTERLWQDLQPTPGRLNSSLRIVLSTVIALVLMMALQMPAASVGLYFIFLVGRDSPSVSLRSGFFSLLTLAFTVATVLGVVILSDNNPMARVLSVAVVVFLAGVLMLSTTLPTLPQIWGFIYCTLIAFWEAHAPSDYLVKQTLYVVGTVSLAIACSVAVEYVFAVKDPVAELQNQRKIRYEALSKMFSLFAQGAPREELVPAVIGVSKLAAAGQIGMMHLYNTIVDRSLDPGSLPIGTRVRITMLAQLMDVSAAFGTQNLDVTDMTLQERCGHLAKLCLDLIHDIRPRPEEIEAHGLEPNTTNSANLLDRVDESLHSILSMPNEIAGNQNKELIALPSHKVPFFIPGAVARKETLAFGLKLSLCATLCYLIVRAVDWPGISTAVLTVVIAGLSTSAAIKQKLIFRLIGAAIGGLVLGMGATIYLFPHMDSITSLVVLVAAVAMLSAWWAAGRQFNYVGLQIAFAFYLVAFEGLRAPTELAPARDRTVGILLALVIMAFVFDLVWPVRTVTAMRGSLATMMGYAAEYLRSANATDNLPELRRHADGIRDQIGKTVGNMRSMGETVEYEFGVDVKQHMLTSETLLRASLTLVALFWNQFAILHREEDFDYLQQPSLIAMRAKMADGMDRMAEATLNKTEYVAMPEAELAAPALLADPRYGEFACNTLDRFREFEVAVSRLKTLA